MINMKNEDFLLIIVLILIIIIISFVSAIKIDKQDEQIKQLEQSLAEQIQEKQVYINILERSSNGD